jgi:hypothetical protein
VLRTVNHASLATLDDRIALDARAARNIVAHRNGADGLAGTADDRRFATLAELDTVSFVGPVAFEKLVAFVQSRPLSDVLPAGAFRFEVTTRIPVTRSKFNAIAQGGPYNTSETQVSTRTHTFEVSSDGVTIRVATGTLGLGTPLPDTIDAAGNFAFATSREGLTPDQRRIFWNESQLAGHLDSLGELVIDDLYEIGGSGSQIFGYSGTITELAGAASAELPYVEPR